MADREPTVAALRRHILAYHCFLLVIWLSVPGFNHYRWADLIWSPRPF